MLRRVRRTAEVVNADYNCPIDTKFFSRKNGSMPKTPRRQITCHSRGHSWVIMSIAESIRKFSSSAMTAGAISTSSGAPAPEKLNS